MRPWERDWSSESAAPSAAAPTKPWERDWAEEAPDFTDVEAGGSSTARAVQPEPEEEATLTTAMSRGIGQVYQGANAAMLDQHRRALEVMDRVDRGERFLPDPSATAYQLMGPEQRRAARARAEAGLAEAAKGVAQHGQAMATIPRDEAVTRLTEAKDFGDVWDAFASDPVKVIGHLGAESLPGSTVGMGAAVAGGLARVPGASRALTAAGGMGAGSAAVEYASSIVQALQEAGVNVNDPEALARATGNAEMMAAIREKAAAKAGMVGLFDAASAGVASKVLAPASMASRPVAREAVNVAAQAPVQGALGAAGEAAGSVAAGDEVQPGALAAEFFGEFAGAPGEVASMAAAGSRPKPAPPPGPDRAAIKDAYMRAAGEVDPSFTRLPSEAERAAERRANVDFATPDIPGMQADNLTASPGAAAAPAGNEVEFTPNDPLAPASAVEGAQAAQAAAQADAARAAPYTPEEVAQVKAGLMELERETPRPPRGNEIDIRPFLEERALMRAQGLTLADWLAQGDLLGRPFSPQTVDLVERIDALAATDLEAARRVQRLIETFDPAKEAKREAAKPATPEPAPAPDAEGARPREEVGAQPAAAGATGKAPAAPEVASKPVEKQEVKGDLPPLEFPSGGKSVDAAAAQANPNPSRAQILAGNAKLGHDTLMGLPVAFENMEGSIRRDVHNDPPKWKRVIKLAHYGKWKGVKGADGEDVDVFVKPGTDRDWKGPVFVIDQLKAGGTRFDEHKFLVGYDTEAEARAAYAANYPRGWKVGTVSQMTVDEFKAWTKSPFTKRAIKSLSRTEWKQAVAAAHPPMSKEEVESLMRVQGSIGWAEEGGRLLRAADTGKEKPEVVGRTSWLAKDSFWPGRPNPKSLTVAVARSALEKIQAGEPLSKPEQDFVDYAETWLAEKEAEYAAALEERGYNRKQRDASGFTDADPAVQAAVAEIVDEPFLPDDEAPEQLEEISDEELAKWKAEGDEGPGVAESQAAGRGGEDRSPAAKAAEEPVDPYGPREEGAAESPTLDPLRNRARTGVPGLTFRAGGIERHLKAAGATQLVGQVVRSPQDLAELAQVYRNPHYEVFRIFYTKGDTIVHATGVSARLPGQTPVFPDRMDHGAGVAWVQNEMNRAGADGYWILHNHPSGNPEPSQSDIVLTRDLAKAAPGFRGHVIINHKSFTTISVRRDGIALDRDHIANENLRTPLVESGAVGLHVTTPDQVADMGKRFEREGWVSLIAVAGDQGVTAVAEIAPKTLTNPKRAPAIIRAFARRTGGGRVFIAGPWAELRGVDRAILEGLVSEAFVTDVVGWDQDDKVDSLRMKVIPRAGAAFGEVAGRRMREGVESGDGQEAQGRAARDRGDRDLDGSDLYRTLGGGRPAQGWARATRIRGAGGPAQLGRGERRPLSPADFAEDALGVASGNPSSGLGVWMTSDLAEARSYGTLGRYFVDMRKPKVMGFEDLPGFDSLEEAAAYRKDLEAQGYDGIVLHGKNLGKNVHHVVLFRAEQVIVEREENDLDFTSKPKFARGKPAADQPALELTGETEAQIKAREAQEKKAAEEKAKQDRAPGPEGFVLTGSDRQVDQAEARGQQSLFRLGAEMAPIGLDASDLRRDLAPALKNSRVPVRVVQLVEDLPFEAASDARGAYDGTRVWLVSDNLPTLADAERTLLKHEFTHAGVDILYGRDKGARERALKDLQSKNKKLREHASAWRVSYGEEMVDELVGDGMTKAQAQAEMLLTSMEEAVAYFAETAESLNGWKSFVATIQKGLRALGLTRLADLLEDATDATAIKAVAEILRATQRQPETAPAGEAQPAFSRARNAQEAPTWYSELAAQVEGIKTASAPAAQWAATLKGLKGVKADELEWSGVLDWLATREGKVTKAEVQAFLEQNGVKVEETMLGEGTTKSATSEMDKRIQFARTPPGQPAPGSWQAPDTSSLDNLIYTLQDKHVDTKRVLAEITKAKGRVADAMDPYLQEELYHGRTAKAVKDFLEAELNPLLKDMATRGVKIADFEEWLHARHAAERNAQIARINPALPDGGSGMTNAEAAQVLANARSAGMDTAYRALAARVDAINAKTRQELVAYGLEAPATVAAWQQAYRNYVPLQREDMEGGMGTGQGFSIRGNATKRATGSTRPVVDILANLAMQRERTIVRGEKARVGHALLGLAEANPNPGFWRVDQPPMISRVDPRTGMVTRSVDPLYQSRNNVIVVPLPDGAGNIVNHAVVFNESDPRAMRMVESLKGLDVDQLMHGLGLIAKVTRYFASINTQLNPVFGVVNLTRDVQAAMLNLTSTSLAGRQAEVLAHLPSALRGIYADLRDTRAGKTPTSTWAAHFEDFQKAGGQTGYRDMFRTSDERTKEIERELARAQAGATGMPRKAWDHVAGWLTDYNNAMENAVRLSAYRVAVDGGMTRARAAELAKNLTVNFNRKGQAASQLGALFAFFNASAQGTARLAETMTGPKGRQIAAGGVLLGVLQAAALAAMGFDDEEPPDFVRERSLVIPLPGTDKKYLTIPMPLGFHVLPNLGRTAAELFLSGGRGGAEKISRLMQTVLEAFNPIGSGTLAQTLSPTPMDPIVALGENRDWTGKPIAREDFNKLAPTPGHTRAKDTATAWAKAISYGLNAMSGGTAHTPGVFSPTPDQVDYMIGQFTGGVGREVSKAAQTVTSLATGQELPPHKIPLAGRFYGDAQSGSAHASRFYTNVRRMNELEAEVKGRTRAGEPLGEFLRENPEAKLVKQANAVERRVAGLRREMREAQAKGQEERARRLEEDIKARMERFNEQVRRARGD